MLGFDALKIEITGGSHQAFVGAIVHGIPAGLPVDTAIIDNFTERRKSRSAFTTARREPDVYEFVSGVSDGFTNGGDIEIIIKNTDTRSGDYEGFKATPRPSHADYTAVCRYGASVDMRGSGRFSGRMTAPLTVLGGLAAGILKARGIETLSYVSEIGGIKGASYKDEGFNFDEYKSAIKYPINMISGAAAYKAEVALEEAKRNGDSLGGVVECVVKNLPTGLGGELEHGLETKISSAIFTIPAVKGLEFGEGFGITKLTGSRANDAFSYDKFGKVITLTNRSGGLNGGITNGMPLTLSVAFRPTPSISVPQKTVDLENHSNTELIIKGRHDACITTRAAVVVESMTALSILDELVAEDTKNE